MLQLDHVGLNVDVLIHLPIFRIFHMLAHGLLLDVITEQISECSYGVPLGLGFNAYYSLNNVSLFT